MTDLLHANDATGPYPATVYAADVAPGPPRPSLDGDARCDLVVVGGGFTGLSAALTAAEAGLDVIVLDAHRAGWGASGRNGGQMSGGQRVDQQELEARYGMDRARALWDLGEAAAAMVRDRIARHDIECDLAPRLTHAAHRRRYRDDYKAEAEHMARVYDAPWRFIDETETQALLGTEAYHAGVRIENASHLNPLAYALGLARAAEAAGARICELTEVRRIEIDGPRPRAVTDIGAVEAEHMILAGNGYLGDLAPPVARRVMPINNYVIATEPLGEARAKALIADGGAVADSRFVINYYRIDAATRMVFGGRESYGYRFPNNVKGFVRGAMLKIYPGLADARIDYGWGGTLAITMDRLPHLARLTDRVLTAGGYSGHGVAMATFCGALAAEAVTGRAARFDAMAAIPNPPFPGGPAMRSPLLALAMTWYALRDRL